MSKKIKCLVWDLDNTLWNGTLLENDDVKLKDGIKDIIKELDRRGILLSIASKNEYDHAFKKLESFGISEYFIYPQICWNNKSKSIKAIADALNIGIDTFAFIDDQPSELEEVRFTLPEVLTLNADEYKNILNMERFTPKYITEDSKLRRQMYIDDLQRKANEESFEGPNEEFLKTLDMILTISPVKKGDLERVEELTVRTNQLNSTGTTYSFEQLESFIDCENHIFLITSLKDKFGSYGKMGLILLEETENTIEIKMLLMSCRVMTKGIGSALLIYIANLAAEKGKKLIADFIDTGKNRIMYITYKLMGFEEIETYDNKSVLTYNGGKKDFPDYLKIQCN